MDVKGWNTATMAADNGTYRFSRWSFKGKIYLEYIRHQHLSMAMELKSSGEGTSYFHQI